MSQSLEHNNEPLPTDAPEGSDINKTALSRRHFVVGSAALVGSLLIERATTAQAAAPTVGTSLTGVPHDFGLRTAPVHSRAPLAPSPFLALPLGSVKARGWLLRQLELQRDGLTGHADEIYDLYPATKEDSAWKGGTGEDWEKGPYYLKGLTALAYTLDDDHLKAKVKTWVEPILASQRPDGYFGPKNDDWWPRMVATYLLRDYAEASGDKRIVTLLTGYYRYMNANLPTRPLIKWGKARADDEIDTIFWLYNRTGDEFLLTLADLLAKQGYPWTEMFTANNFLEKEDEFMVTHNVNVTQALKMPVVYSQRSGKAEDKAAYRAGFNHLMRDHGTSFGINTGTEMLAGRSSVEGVETCSTVEYLLSAETALRILGDARIGDELEVVAFNALPAAFSTDFHQHVYYTISNNVSATVGKVGYGQDHGNDRLVAPQSGFPCCCYNMHMGWPKLAQNAWAATRDGGLAVLAYVPSQVSTPLASGQSVTVICETNYPFEETILMSVQLEKPERFPLQLRIPGWCQSPVVKVNGTAVKSLQSGTFATINRQWKAGDVVVITFPMKVETIPGINDSVSVRRGPLVYALGLKENRKIVATNQLPSYESYEVTSDSPWNYALEVNSANPDSSFKVVSKKGSANPYETGQAPVTLQVKGRRVEQWSMRADGRLSLEPPISPVATNSQAETLKLVPFGSQMLRVSLFPVVGTPTPTPKTWKEDFTGDYAKRWVVHRGGFLNGNKLQLPRSAKGIAAAAVFSDFVYDAEVTVGPQGDAGVLFRVSNDSLGVDQYQGYYVGINAEKKAVFLGKASNNFRRIVLAEHAVEVGKVHRLRVEARGSQIKVWVDDMTTPVLEASDASYTTGALGIRSYTKPAEFGKLSASAL